MYLLSKQKVKKVLESGRLDSGWAQHPGPVLSEAIVISWTFLCASKQGCGSGCAPDLHYFGTTNPHPNQSERPDPDQHQSQK
jgi:hypothetical protein